MRPWEVSDNIGKDVSINPFRDLGMDWLKRRIIGKTCTLVKQCKSGLLQVSHDGIFYSLPMTNVDVIVK